MDWFKTMDSTWTLFLDRDGVINERNMHGYILDKKGFLFLPGVIEAISQFSTIFSRIIVVTNQQGLGKKLMTERNLLDIHHYMCMEIEKNGGKIDACYFAPELKLDPNSTRKPKPNMALKAQLDFPEIDFSKSVMVGDTDSDILFGKNLGMKTVRIKTSEKIGLEADLTVRSLQELSLLWQK